MADCILEWADCEFLRRYRCENQTEGLAECNRQNLHPGDSVDAPSRLVRTVV